MPTYFDREDLARLQHLRAVLVAIEGRTEGTPAPRYWAGDRDLELYDETFAERIGWKWRAALAELAERGFQAPPGRAVDFGCGTGVAARAWLGAPFDVPRRVALWDRERGARAFAARRLAGVAPDVEVTSLERAPTPADLAGDETLLVSHVLDELSDDQASELVALARRAAAVVWVEPGSRLTSRRLSAARDRLLDDFAVVVPCTHSERCGALRGDPERSWCHFFAEPDQAVYTEGRWAELGRELGIDLRALPYAYFAAVKRPAHAGAAEGARLLGRPRLQRGRALLDTCEAAGVREEVLLQRLDKALFKALEKSPPRRLVLEREAGKVVAVRPPAGA